MTHEALPEIVSAIDCDPVTMEVDGRGNLQATRGPFEALTGRSMAEEISWKTLFVDEGRATALASKAAEAGIGADILSLSSTDEMSAWAYVLAIERGDELLVILQDVTSVIDGVTQLERHQGHLEALHSATKSLLQTTEFEKATEEAVTGITSALDQELVGIWLYDANEKLLEPTAASATSEAVIPSPPRFDGDSGSIAWDAYKSGETRVIDDMAATESDVNPDTTIGSEVIAPLGEYGVMIVASQESHAFPASDVAVIEVWASTVTMVLLRIHREHLLRARQEEALRERDRLEEFASLMSHDLRNPLTVANGYLDLAQSEVESPHLPRVKGALERMEVLITDMLTLAREGWQGGDPEPIDFEEAVENAWNMADTNSATLEANVSGTIHADPGQLAQLLENLFQNAATHGGEDVLVTVSNVDRGFYVEDDGVGVDPDRRSKMFDAGYSTIDDGTGFGLAIVEAIVEAHDWDVDVEEGSDGGARFVFRDVEIS